MAVKDVEAKKGQRTRQVYDLLVADGADVGSFGEFNRWLYSEGERGYENRRRVYEAFRADGASVGTYDEFRDWLNGGGGAGAAAKGQAQTTAAAATKPMAAPKPVAAVKPVGAAQAAAAVAPKEVTAAVPKPAAKPAAKAAVKPAGQGKAQAGMAVGRMYSMRSGGKDFQVSEADVVNAGGFDAWAAQNASRYKDLRVYMRNAKGERVHTDVGNVKQRAAEGWWAEALPKKRGEAKAYQGEQTSMMSSDDVFHTPFSFENEFRRSMIKKAGGVPETELFPVVGESKGEPAQGGGSTGAVSAGSVKDAKAVGVEVDAATGKKRTVYELPDGSRTTDIVAVTASLGSSLKTRVSRTYEREFKERMKENNLNPENERDVQIQQIDDRISENERKLKRINAERERKLQEKESEGSDWDKFVHMVGGAAHRSMTANVPQVEQNLSEEDHVIKDLIAENLMLTQQAIQLKSSKNLKKAEGMWNGTFDVKNNVRNFFTGVMDKLRDPDLYAMGVVALHNGERLDRIKGKLERGEKLTSSELNLAESVALIGRSSQYVDMPHMYTAGQVTTEMVPFMLQMAANPASGLSRGLVKKYGTNMAKKIGLAIVGDVAEAAVLTNTLQAPKTLADIKERHRGELYEVEPGQFAFEGGESWLKAIAKGQGAAVIEDYTELLGGHFGVISSALGKGASAVGRKVGLGNVMAKASALVNNIKATDVAKALACLEKRANWNGSFGEILEEEAGIVLNALTVGDNKLSDLVDAEQQIDIILGVGLFGGFLSGVKTAAYPVERMRANIKLIDSERVGAYRFGDNWNTIKNRIETAEDKDLATVVRGLVVEHCQSPEMAQSVMKYAQALVTARGLNLAKVAVDRENAEKNGGKVDEQAAREQAIENLAENSILGSYENGAQGEPAGPGLNADGSPMEAVGQATMKFEDREVEVLSGRVVMMDDGSMVDNANSDPSIVVRDLATGKVEMVAPDAILSYEDYTSAGDGGAVADGGNMVSSDAALDVNSEAAPDAASTDGTPGASADAESAMAAEQEQGQGQEMDKPRYGAGRIVVRDASGSLSRGWLTGEVVTEDNYAELGLSRDDIGKYEYYLEGNLNELSYASEQELDDMVSEFVPDETVASEADEAAVDEQADGASGAVEAADSEAVVEQAGTDGAAEASGAAEIPSAGEGTVGNGEQVAAQPVGEQPANDVPITSETVPNPTENPVSDAEIVPEAVSPLQSLPLDEQGVPVFEKAESPELAWDALVEFSDGDVGAAQEVADLMVEEKRKAFEKAQKLKSKGKNPAEILASRKANRAVLAKAQEEFEMWQKMAAVEQNRQAAIRSQQEAEARRIAAERAEAEKAERAAQEEAARKEREALEGIPEWHMDTPENARARGSRRFSGQLFMRQEPVQGVTGKEVEVKFSQNDLPKGRVAVIEASLLQPSHMQGHRNPMFFIEEAQPKNRAEAVSTFAAKQIAEGIRPEEITGSTTAYTGAPTVNARGEVIQGNNRADGLRYLWENNLPEQQTAYKQYLIDNAKDLGLDPEAVNAMKQPVLVNMLDVDDSEAIRLGQMTAQDTESGGIERIKPKNVAQKLGDSMRQFANMLLRSGDEEASFGQLVDRNGADVLKWMSQLGAITNTQYQSAFDSKGNLTAEAKNDLQKVLYQAVFKGGSAQLEEMFDRLPAKAQRALLSTAFRDMDSPFAGKLLPEIQASIAAYNQLMLDPVFAEAKKMEEVLRAVEAFKSTIALDDRFEQYSPADNFSNFALHLAAMYKASDMSQSTIAGYFTQMYDLAQGKKEATLFEEADTTEYPLADVIKKVLNIDYQPAKNGNNNVANGGADVALLNKVGQGGKLRGYEPPASGEQTQAGTEPSERGAGASDDSRGQKPTLIEAVKALYQYGKEYAARLYQRTFFDVAATPDFMKALGLTGDKFTIRYGVISRHIGKDGSHDISEQAWKQFPDALQRPFAITKNKSKDGGYRVYTTIQNDKGEYIVVGVEVKPMGRDIEVNAITTAFGRRNNAGVTQDEELIYTSKEITPEQQSLLDGPNSHQYPAEGELSEGKGNSFSSDKQISEGEKSDNSDESDKASEDAEGISGKAKPSEHAAPVDEGVFYSKGRTLTQSMREIGQENNLGFDVAVGERYMYEGREIEIQAINGANVRWFDKALNRTFEEPAGMLDGVEPIRPIKDAPTEAGKNDVRMSVGEAVEGNQTVYEVAKGMLEAAGIAVHEVSDEQAQAMFGNKKTPVAGQPNRANEKLTSGSMLERAMGDSTSSAPDSVKAVAKIDKNTQSAKNNIRKFANGDFLSGKMNLSTVDRALSALGRLLSMRSSGGSRYVVLRSEGGSTVAIRVSDHGANGNNFKRDGADENLSIVIERRSFNTPKSEIEFTEAVIPVGVFESRPEDVFGAIVSGVDSVLKDGEFTLPSEFGSVGRKGGAVRELRRVDGVVYGWTVGGEVYLNRDAMNPGTPVHEYTHLWDLMVQRENPALWARGKELMRQTVLWDEVRDDPAYADIRDDEDAVASEVHARLTGERGAEVLERMVEDARKDGALAVAETVSLVSRLRQWLREMFEGLKKTLGKWSKRDLQELTVEQFTDMTLRDLAEGINPNHGDKELVTLHNISESKLRKAIKVGGLANPSMAVVKAGRNSHDGYGEITLVARGAMADKGSGRNAGTWAGDAWTPRYPVVEREQAPLDKARVIASIAEDVPEVMRDLIVSAWNSHLSGGNESGLAYWFLSGRDEAPQIARRERRFDKNMAEQVLGIVKERALNSLDEAEAHQLRDIYLREVLAGDEAKYAESMELSTQSAREHLDQSKGLRRMRAEVNLDLMERLGLLPSVEKWVNDIRSDVRIGERVDEYATSSEANRIIEDRGLSGEYERWIDGLDSRYGVQERLFAGYTRSGARRYLDNTLQNASRLMRSEGRNGATGLGSGFSTFVASVLKPMKSHKEMRAQSDRLREGSEQTEAFDKKWSDVYFDLAMKCQPDAERISDDYGFYRLNEAALKPNPAKYLKDEYGVELSGEFVDCCTHELR